MLCYTFIPWHLFFLIPVCMFVGYCVIAVVTQLMVLLFGWRWW